MRSMKFALLPMSVALLAAPAFAQSDEIVFVPGTGAAVDMDSAEPAPFVGDKDNDGDIDDIAEKLANPAVQDGVATVVERMTGAMMKMPVGQFADAIETARPGTVKRSIRRDATIADLAGRDAEYLPEELGARSREAMGMMSGFARAFAVMMPEFERIGREMEESFKAAKAEARRKQD